jgi:hypothetical protein
MYILLDHTVVLAVASRYLQDNLMFPQPVADAGTYRYAQSTYRILRMSTVVSLGTNVTLGTGRDKIHSTRDETRRTRLPM